jgi:purine-nucleoside/S-methyl-5'-thioadenosine phosphorylase / adenosine deaminase
MTPETTAPGSGTRVERGGLPLVTWPALQRPGLDAFVTTRHGGVSTGACAGLNLGLHVGDRDADVLANRARVAAALGASPDDFVFAEQVHSPTATVVTDEHRGAGAYRREDAVAATDALVTATPGIVLAVLVADCVPLVLFDPVARVLACVHAGWGGTVRGVTRSALTAMRSLGTDPADVVAGIGPSVHPDRYQVGADVAAAAEAEFGDRLGEVVRPDGTGRWTFDLWRANTIQLVAGGVPEPQVHVAGLGTGPGTDFPSHRFEGPCGRFAAVARLTGDPR